MALGSEHAQLLEQRDALERQYAALALAIETLGRADAELQSRFSPQLAQKAADYMDYLTGGRYDELVLARDLSAKARSADDRRRATRPISRRGRRICCTCPCVWRCAS